MDKTFYVVAVKATRRPLLLASCTWPVAYVTADNHYAVWRSLSGTDLASTGVSFRIYDYDPSGVEMGDPDFVLGKPALMSWGAV